ncbi:hypothetical protein ACLQ3K_21845 [Tsukamurella sp. DT100]|uniref:hypothetical protein n=1 Tax=Tsukamurella sp. DT100 TaxID=3393415 RepID=UPI003CF06FE3
MTTDLRRPTRTTIASSAAAALLALAAGCSSTDSPTTAPAPSVAATSAETSPAAPPGSAKAKAVSLTDALTAAGAQCTTGTKGQDCTLSGVKLTLSSGTWGSDTALRRRACTEGYVNSTYKVITDGRDMITTDFNKDLAAIITALREHGADPREASYCP